MKVFFYAGAIVFLFGCTSFKSSADCEKIADKITENTLEEPKEQESLCLEETAEQQKNIFRAAIAKDGAKVSVTVASFEYPIFQISGERFKSCEVVNFISNSCGEVLYFSIQADKNGNIPAMGFSPEVIGQSGGLCHIDILREHDSIHLQFPWGTEL